MKYRFYRILSLFTLISSSFLINSCEKKEDTEKKVNKEFTCSNLLNSIYGNNISKVEEILTSNKSLANCEEATTTQILGPELTKRPLTLAARLGRTEIAQTLLDNGAEINFIDNGKTALLYAIDNFKPEIVEILINNKANKDIKYESFENALAYAIHWRNFSRKFPGLLDHQKLLEIIKLLS